MSVKDRTGLLTDLEARRGSRVLVYVTGDRPGFETKIAGDVVRLMRRHLESIGEVPKLDLYLYSRGGNTVVPWRLVNLLREYAQHFSVIVPFRAHSAATMICLGADEVVMTKMGELAPVDPSTSNAFNPDDPKTQQKIEISVEDMAAYLDLARDRGSLDPKGIEAASFARLAEAVHPLALGHVHRAYMGIRQFCRKLLGLRTHNPLDDEDAERLIDALTYGLYAHNYPISRSEAQELGLRFVTLPEPALESLIWSVFEAYELHLELNAPFEPLQILGSDEEVEFKTTSAIIESTSATDEYVRKGKIRRTRQVPKGAPPGMEVETGAVHVVFQGWLSTR